MGSPGCREAPASPALAHSTSARRDEWLCRACAAHPAAWSARGSFAGPPGPSHRRGQCQARSGKCPPGRAGLRSSRCSAGAISRPTGGSRARTDGADVCQTASKVPAGPARTEAPRRLRSGSPRPPWRAQSPLRGHTLLSTCLGPRRPRQTTHRNGDREAWRCPARSRAAAGPRRSTRQRGARTPADGLPQGSLESHEAAKRLVSAPTAAVLPSGRLRARGPRKG